MQKHQYPILHFLFHQLFLLLGIGVYFALLIIYTFKTLFISGLVYLIFIPISFLHFKKIEKDHYLLEKNEDQETKDIL